MVLMLLRRGVDYFPYLMAGTFPWLHWNTSCRPSPIVSDCSGSLTGALLREGLIDEAWVFVGPRLLADEEAFGPARGFTTMRIEDGVPMRLLSVHRRGPDALLHYRFGG